MRLTVNTHNVNTCTDAMHSHVSTLCIQTYIYIYIYTHTHPNTHTHTHRKTHKRMFSYMPSHLSSTTYTCVVRLRRSFISDYSTRIYLRPTHLSACTGHTSTNPNTGSQAHRITLGTAGLANQLLLRNRKRAAHIPN